MLKAIINQRREDFNKFMSVIEDNLWKTFFTTLYYTGMRKGEIQALTWNDIDFCNNVNFSDNYIIAQNLLHCNSFNIDICAVFQKNSPYPA